jgi:hypothetical protein
MTPEDIIDVLSAVAAIDRRTVGEADAIVWHQIIGNLPKDDALTAVINHARECPGIWLEPGHIVAEVRAIRRDRYERERAEYEREERDAKVAAIVAELAERKAIPDDEPLTYRRPTISALAVACPWCHASPGTRCTTPGTRQPLVKSRYHPSRLDALTAPRRTPHVAPRGPEDAAWPLCTVCGTHPLVTDDDTARGTCEPCENVSTQPQPDTNGGRQNA